MPNPAFVRKYLIEKARRLYTLPAVAMEVLELTNNPEVDTHALKACIEKDPSLTGKILRTVNSSLFGFSRRISDLGQGLAMLGIKPLKLLVLGFNLPPQLFEGVEARTLGWYWRHTLTKAVAGREISEALFDTPGDDAFIAGLLQDLGCLLLIQELGRPYVRLLERVAAGDKDLATVETEAMGFDHTTLSAELLSHWGLPENLVEAVAWDTVHRRSKTRPSAEPALPRTLRLAELFARLLADEQPGVLAELLETARQCPDFSETQLEALIENLQERVAQLADVLSLELPAGRDYRDLLVQAHAQLATVAAEAAGDLARPTQCRPRQPVDESLVSEIRGLTEAMSDVYEHPPAPDHQADTAPGEVQPAAAPATPEAAAPGRVASTGVATMGTEPGLTDRLALAVATCRQSRCPLSLLLVRLDHTDELMLTRGMDGFQRLLRFLRTVCESVDHPTLTCTAMGEAGFALILPDCERRQAIQMGNQLIGRFRRLAPSTSNAKQQAVSISVGLATVSLPPRNFPAQDLLTAADRCLYGSAASGGNVVKSIEIY